MIKSQKGITIVSLVITIIVMLIILSVSYVTGRELLISSKIKGYITTMYMVKGEIENMYESYQFDSNTAHLKGSKLDVSDDTVKNKMTSIYNNEILSKITDPAERAVREQEIHDTENWYFLTKDNVNELGVETDMLENNEVFIVNYNTGVIIYSKGYTVNGDTFYSLEGLSSIDI